MLAPHCHTFIEQSIWEEGHQVQFSPLLDHTHPSPAMFSENLRGSYALPRETFGNSQSLDL